jgi:hyperosmotically inducible periplasmic protein
LAVNYFIFKKVKFTMKKSIEIINLCAITSLLSLSGCWLVAGATGAEGAYLASQEERTVGETVDDQIILASLKTKLLADPIVSGLKINVDVNQGIVTLRGYVDTQAELERAVELAYLTSGVKQVNSKMVLD